MKFTWYLTIVTWRFFIDLRWLKSRENKLPPTKTQQKFTPFFTLLNFNEIGWKQFNENDHMASVFVPIKYCTWNPRKIISTSKVRNPNSRFFSCETGLKDPKSAKLNPATWYIVNEFLFRAIWVSLYPDFNYHGFGNCVDFSGKKVTPPPPSPSPRVPVRLCLLCAVIKNTRGCDQKCLNYVFFQEFLSLIASSIRSKNCLCVNYIICFKINTYFMK